MDLLNRKYTAAGTALINTTYPVPNLSQNLDLFLAMAIPKVTPTIKEITMEASPKYKE